MVFHDKDGKVLASGVKRWVCPWNPLLAKAVSLRFGVLVALRLGWSSTIFKSDNINLVSFLKSNKRGFNPVFGIIDDISLLVRSFSSISWSFVKREECCRS